MKKISVLLCFVIAGVTAVGQKTEYTIVNRKLTGDGKGGIYLNGAEGAGVAWIKGLAFTDGVIEFDIKGRDEQQRSFVGFAFHGVNDSTYEAVYFRPFNFRSADPVRKGHAVQYVADPNFDWPVLREKYPNKYEQPVDPVPDPNDWFHAKITVSAEKIEVFVNGNPKPSLVVKPLVHSHGKLTGFWVGNGSDGGWRDLRVNGNPVIK
jgi:hypothetical protein